MPLLRVRRGAAEPEVGLETSFMPSGPRGMESLPPIAAVYGRMETMSGASEGTGGSGETGARVSWKFEEGLSWGALGGGAELSTELRMRQLFGANLLCQHARRVFAITQFWSSSGVPELACEKSRW